MGANPVKTGHARKACAGPLSPFDQEQLRAVRRIYVRLIAVKSSVILAPAKANSTCQTGKVRLNISAKDLDALLTTRRNNLPKEVAMMRQKRGFEQYSRPSGTADGSTSRRGQTPRHAMPDLRRAGQSDRILIAARLKRHTVRLAWRRNAARETS